METEDKQIDMNILERRKWGCTGLETQLKEVKGDTLEIYLTNGSKCTKNKHFRKRTLNFQERKGIQEKSNQQVDNWNIYVIINCKAIGHLE